MRTQKEITTEINEIIGKINEDLRKPPKDRMKKQVRTRLTKRMVFLRLCDTYLKTEPSVLFLTEEIVKLENKISLRMIGFPVDKYSTLGKTYLTKIKNEYEKQYDVPKLRDQLRTLRFLLK